MLDTTKALISIDELRTNNEKIKEYIKSKELGLSEAEINSLVDEKLIPVNETMDTALSNKSDIDHNHADDYDSLGAATEALSSANEYTDTAVAQKSQVQFVIWEEDD